MTLVINRACRVYSSCAATEWFVKVNSYPFLFQVDLEGEIDTKESSGVVDKKGVHFHLVKVVPKLWSIWIPNFSQWKSGDKKMIVLGFHLVRRRNRSSGTDWQLWATRKKSWHGVSGLWIVSESDLSRSSNSPQSCTRSWSEVCAQTIPNSLLLIQVCGDPKSVRICNYATEFTGF